MCPELHVPCLVLRMCSCNVNYALASSQRNLFNIWLNAGKIDYDTRIWCSI